MNSLTRLDFVTDQKEPFGLLLQTIDTVNGGQLKVPMYKIESIGAINKVSFVNNDKVKLFEELKSHLDGRVVLKQFLELEPIDELELKTLIMGLLS